VLEKLCLLPQAERFNQRPITRKVRALEILKQPAATANHLEQSAPRVVITAVGVKVAPELVDPMRQDGDLNRGTAAIFVVKTKLLDQLILRFCCDGHGDRASARGYSAGEAAVLDTSGILQII
jgi:hypothetical protein